MRKCQCPSENALSFYALGTLDESSAEALSEHVEHCATCEQTLREFDSLTDSVVSRLRPGNVEVPFVDDLVFQQRLSAIEIGQEPTFAVNAPTSMPTTGSAKPLATLGEYQLLGMLGEGGMGIVYKAMHMRLEKVVAIKMLTSSLHLDPNAINRFAREMKAAGRLDHVHLIRAFDAGEANGMHYLVTEFVDGVDLSVLVKQTGPLPIPEACELIRQAALGLEHAHQQGMVHRDIKPSNLMLTSQGQVKVLDMGLALLSQFDAPAKELTATGTVVGTVDYMAPEQVNDSHTVDRRADIYSLGASLYKLLTGRGPLNSPARDSLGKMLVAVAHSEPQPIRSIRPEISVKLAATIHRLIAKDPGNRMATAAEVAESLRPFAIGSDLQRLTHSQRPQGSTNPAEETLVSRPGRLPDSRSVQVKTDDSGLQEFPPIIRWTAVGGLGAAMVFAAIIFLMRTPEGVVRFEINDPQVQVQFKDTGVVITGADSEPITVKAGEKQLIITRDGFSFQTDSIALSRGETILVKVQLIEDHLTVLCNDTVIGKAALPSKPDGTVAGDVSSAVSEKWLNVVSGSPVEQQLAAVEGKLRELNPNFKSPIQYEIKDGAVNVYKFSSSHVADITPLRALTKMTWLELFDDDRRGTLVDLSPLHGMQLEYLDCHGLGVTDLTPLKGLPLWQLNLDYSKVSDIAPLRGMPLLNVNISMTKVADLSPLKDAPLETVWLYNSAVTDLSALSGKAITHLDCRGSSITDFSVLRAMPLILLGIDFDPKRDTEMLRSITTLKTINDQPAAEFWKSVAEP